MIGYQFLLLAEEEMIEAAKYYEGEAQGLGADFLDDIQRTIDRILNNPRIGQTIDNQLRRSLCSCFPYSLIYAIDNDEVLIVAVAHQRRKPFYWKERIK
jgi:toxin ParE1/3/4